MQLRGQRDVGHDDDVQGAGSVLGFLGNITAGVVLVFAFALALPGSAGNGDGAFGGGLCRGAACRSIYLAMCTEYRGVFFLTHETGDPERGHTKVEAGSAEGSDHDTTEDLVRVSLTCLVVQAFPGN